VRGPGGLLTVEHSPLEPATRYVLDLGWVGGAGARVRFVTRPERRAIRRGPGVGRIDLTAPVWAHFGCEVDRAAVEASWRIEPSVPGAFEWTDDRTVRFVPARLRLGTLYQVAVGGKTPQGEALDEVRWSFRTLIPPPTRIVPGEGAPIVLTFDDGVRNPSQAVKLLDLLETLRVKAILFPVGQWARRYPDLVSRARREGHRICNHSDTHANLSLLTDEVMRGEILRGAGRGECDLLRPPSMGTSPRVERMAASLGYRVYLWDVDSRDWEGLEAEDITNRILSRVRPGAVVLLHMHGAHTLEALPGLVAALEKAGYRPTHEGASGSPTPPEGSPVPGDPPAADGPAPPAGMPEIGPLIEGGAGGGG
jgi:peptidoglycan/xylan/chitin deacetylase (PgdA/CDA1 family)